MLFKCWKCQEMKPRDAFGNDRTRSDGRARKCSDCGRKKNPSTAHLFKPGAPSLFKGKSHTDEAKALMSIAARGNKRRVGKKHTAETRANISKIVRERTPRGASHYAYKNGERQRHLSLRRKPEYVAWRNAVFARDEYKCQDCGDASGGNLRAHHIQLVSQRPDLVYELANGVTLCHPCHELRHYKPDSIRKQRKLKRGDKLWK